MWQQHSVIIIKSSLHPAWLKHFLVCRPGGLITSEAMACGLMMVPLAFLGQKFEGPKPLSLTISLLYQVVVDPYPGQEERNASMLLEEGAGA